MWAKREEKEKSLYKKVILIVPFIQFSLTWSSHDLGSHQHLSFIADEAVILTRRNRHTQTHHTQQNIERHTHIYAHTYT